MEEMIGPDNQSDHNTDLNCQFDQSENSYDYLFLLQIVDADTECGVDMLGTRTTRLPFTAKCCVDKNIWLEQ